MQWFCFKPNLLSLIDQIHGDSSQILDLGFSFSFSEMGKEITSRAQEITPVEPQMAGLAQPSSLTLPPWANVLLTM